MSAIGSQRPRWNECTGMSVQTEWQLSHHNDEGAKMQPLEGILTVYIGQAYSCYQSDGNEVLN